MREAERFLRDLPEVISAEATNANPNGEVRYDS